MIPETNSSRWAKIFELSGADELYRRTLIMALRLIDESDTNAKDDLATTVFVACAQCISKYDMRVGISDKAILHVLRSVHRWFDLQAERLPPFYEDQHWYKQQLSLEAWNAISEDDIIRIRGLQECQ